VIVGNVETVSVTSFAPAAGLEAMVRGDQGSGV